MARSPAPLFASLVLLLVAFFSLLPSPGRAQTADHVVISEVMYDPSQTGTDTSFEWMELF